jgi:aspartate carbamoyltransferase regulatory subunit
MSKEKRIINPIENGFVIDHSLPGQASKIADTLSLYKRGRGVILVADGLPSPRMGRKGLIKVQDLKLGDYELDLVALYSPNATISFIKDWELAEKRKAKIPERLEGLVYCSNPNCITNDSNEKESPLVYFRDNRFVCHYCRVRFPKDEARLNVK